MSGWAFAVVNACFPEGRASPDVSPATRSEDQEAGTPDGLPMCLCLYCLRKKKEEGEARKRLSARFSSPSRGRGGLARVPLPDPIRPRLPRYRRGLDLKSVILRV